MLRKIFHLSLTVVALAFLVAPAGNAAAEGAVAQTIVLYAENRGLARIDNNAAGPDNGDLVHRELALSHTFAGPVIGISYSQSVVIAFDPEARVDVRRVDVEYSLPGGWLFVAGVSEIEIGSVPRPGWTATYAVVGGTGEYAGARGSVDLILLEDDKSFKATITLLK